MPEQPKYAQEPTVIIDVARLHRLEDERKERDIDALNPFVGRIVGVFEAYKSAVKDKFELLTG